eukprot:5056614-Pleurochrysis_carterae.AAC.1
MPVLDACLTFPFFGARAGPQDEDQDDLQRPGELLVQRVEPRLGQRQGLRGAADAEGPGQPHVRLGGAPPPVDPVGADTPPAATGGRPSQPTHSPLCDSFRWQGRVEAGSREASKWGGGDGNGKLRAAGADGVTAFQSHAQGQRSCNVPCALQVDPSRLCEHVVLARDAACRLQSPLRSDGAATLLRSHARTGFGDCCSFGCVGRGVGERWRLARPARCRADRLANELL